MTEINLYDPATLLYISEVSSGDAHTWLNVNIKLEHIYV